MKLRVLTITPEVEADVARVVKFAEQRRLSIHDIARIQKGQDKPPGDFPEYTCMIPVGYRCVFTISQHPFGWCRHLSVSIPSPNAGPHLVAMDTIMALFGFTCLHNKADQMWLEPFGRDRIAINVLQKLPEAS